MTATDGTSGTVTHKTSRKPLTRKSTKNKKTVEIKTDDEFNDVVTPNEYKEVNGDINGYSEDSEDNLSSYEDLPFTNDELHLTDEFKSDADSLLKNIEGLNVNGVEEFNDEYPSVSAEFKSKTAYFIKSLNSKVTQIPSEPKLYDLASKLTYGVMFALNGINCGDIDKPITKGPIKLPQFKSSAISPHTYSDLISEHMSGSINSLPTDWLKFYHQVAQKKKVKKLIKFKLGGPVLDEDPQLVFINSWCRALSALFESALEKRGILIGDAFHKKLIYTELNSDINSVSNNLPFSNTLKHNMVNKNSSGPKILFAAFNTLDIKNKLNVDIKECHGHMMKYYTMLFDKLPENITISWENIILTILLKIPYQEFVKTSIKEKYRSLFFELGTERNSFINWIPFNHNTDSAINWLNNWMNYHKFLFGDADVHERLCESWKKSLIHISEKEHKTKCLNLVKYDFDKPIFDIEKFLKIHSNKRYMEEVNYNNKKDKLGKIFTMASTDVDIYNLKTSNGETIPVYLDSCSTKNFILHMIHVLPLSLQMLLETSFTIAKDTYM